MNSVLVTGGHGFIGWRASNYLARHDFNVTCTHISENPRASRDPFSESETDITDKDQVRGVFQVTEPDVVVHCAAITDVDRCETDRDLARQVNIDGTINILKAAENQGARMIFLSSSFVFNGEKDAYFEQDEPNPVNYYGETKAEAERYIQDSGADHAILRTDQPYGWPEEWQKDTMVTWTLEKLRQGEDFEVFRNWYNNPTYIKSIVAAIKETITREKTGIFHVTGPEHINRYKWAVKIAEAFDMGPSLIKPGESRKNQFPAERPNVKMDSTETVKELNLKPVDVEEGLEKMKEEKEHGG